MTLNCGYMYIHTYSIKYTYVYVSAWVNDGTAYTVDAGIISIYKVTVILVVVMKSLNN